MQCTIFTDTSLNFISTSDPFSTRLEQHKMFSGKNIYDVGISREIVCMERYIGTFFFFFFLLHDSLLSTESGFVLFRRSRVGSSTVYSREIFSVRI